VTPRSDRDAGDAVTSNFLLHAFPAKVSKASMAWSYSFWLGTVSAALLLLLTVSGLPLLFLYVPSVERAYASVKDIEHVVTFGWWIRAVHRIAAHLMVVAVALHLVRVFLTAAYRNGTGRGQQRDSEPERDQFAHRHAFGRRRELGHVGDATGEFALAVIFKRPAIETDRARRRGLLAGDEPDERALARTVRPDHAGHAARMKRKRYGLQDRNGTGAEGDFLQRQQAIRSCRGSVSSHRYQRACALSLNERPSP